MTPNLRHQPATTPLPTSLSPPNMPLPSLPVNKTRIRLTDNPNTEMRRDSSSGLPPTPIASRSATPSALPALQTTGLQPIPGIVSASAVDLSSKPLSAVKTPTRPISVSAFPQPPRSTMMRSNHSSSPASTSITSSQNLPRISSPIDSRARGTSPQSGNLRIPMRRTSGLSQSSRAPSYSANSSPLSEIGEGQLTKTIPSAALLSIPSPPASPPSSHNGSTMTDGTHFEDVDPEPMTKEKPGVETASVNDARSVRSMGKDGKGNVLVSVRVRPEAHGADTSRADAEWQVDGRRSVIRHKRGEAGDFRYDNVFSTHDHNSKVYDSAAKRLVRRVMEGYHGTVFAYGMTGTGKTFSMQGTAQSPGVIPLAITDIFSYIRENPEREFLLRVSYLEIYNERIYDLLSPNASGVGGIQQEEIKLREDSKRGVYAAPLKEEIVQSPTQLLRVIARGDLARRTGSTQFNARSSRSHAVVQIVVESRGRSSGANGSTDKLPGGVLVSTLSLIDLAGSEKAAESKERRTEGSHINKSLLTLGTVISRLSTVKDGKSDDKDKHLPYRDSKLTRLLQPALSGNSLVSILCTVQLSSPASSSAAHTGETLNTLNFASRAKNNIVSHAKRNESHPAHAGAAAGLLDRYRNEIEDLKKQLEEQKQAKDETERVEDEEERWQEREREALERHEEQMLEMQLARTALKERIGHLNRLILSSKSVGVNAGRFSASSTPRASTLGPDAVGIALGSPSASRQSSITSVLPPAPLTPKRAISFGSAVAGVLPAARISQIVPADADDDLEEDASAGSGDGNASLSQQVRALQADLADKNRYISNLERRLLQVRRTSHARPSLPRGDTQELADKNELLAQKDHELDELRARLDDQTRMVNALRSAARKLDNGRRVSSTNDDLPTLSTTKPAPPPPGPPTRYDTRSTSHRSQQSASSSGSKSVNFSRLKRLSSSRSEGSLTNGTVAVRTIRRQKSVEQMTKMLDEMIQARVEDGQGDAMGWTKGHLLTGGVPPLPPLIAGENFI